MADQAQLRIWRGDPGRGEPTDYQVDVNDGEVVLDLLHRFPSPQPGDLAIRCTCKYGKCGSCSMEISGRSRLSFCTLLSSFL